MSNTYYSMMVYHKSTFEFQAKKPWFLGILHWLVFLSGMFLVLVYWYALTIKTLQNQKTEFNLLLDRLIQTTENQIKSNEQVLLGISGLFKASKDVSRQEFKTYFDALKIAERYPGIQGIGFSKWIPPDQLEHSSYNRCGMRALPTLKLRHQHNATYIPPLFIWSLSTGEISVHSVMTCILNPCAKKP
jgi:hypothetical protein